jgi:hypothetical protein
MTDIKVPVDAQAAIQDFLLDRPAETPDDVRDMLKEFVRPGYNPVEASLNMAELIYARRDELPVELLAIGADIAAMVASFGFNGMGGPNGRGAAIAYTIRQMPGVVAAPEATYDPPEPKAEFMPVPVAEPDPQP